MNTLEGLTIGGATGLVVGAVTGTMLLGPLGAKLFGGLGAGLGAWIGYKVGGASSTIQQVAPYVDPITPATPGPETQQIVDDVFNDILSPFTPQSVGS